MRRANTKPAHKAAVLGQRFGGVDLRNMIEISQSQPGQTSAKKRRGFSSCAEAGCRKHDFSILRTDFFILNLRNQWYHYVFGSATNINQIYAPALKVRAIVTSRLIGSLFQNKKTTLLDG